jgi:glutamyl-tRNA synthetase
MTELGVSTSNVDLAMSSVYAANRELIDDGSDRAFLVRDGVRVLVSGGPATAEPPVHPDHEDRGTRTIPVGEAVLVEPDDLPAEGERVWLKGYGPVRYEEGAFAYTDDDIDAVREEGVDVVHWVPAEASVPVRMRTMEGDVSGRAEPGVRGYDPDDVLQFERVGFVRIDRVPEDEADPVTTYFTHP